MKKRIIITLVILAVIGSIAYWLSQKNEMNNRVLTIKIGAILPQTGFLASPGQNVINGINLFIEEFNSQNKDKKIEIVFEDSKSIPKEGVNAINKLINVNRVKLIIGDIGSPIFLAMAPIAEKNKVVMISPGASNPKVREAGDFIFRIYTSDDFDGKVMASYLTGKKNVSNIALLYFNNDYGIGLSEAFVTEYAKFNGKIDLEYTFDENTLDFKEIIMKLKKSDIKNVYFIGSPKQDAAFLKLIKEVNCNLNIYGVLSFEDSEFLQIAQNTFESVEYTTPFFDLGSEDIKMQKFKNTYLEKYKKLPDLNSALGYDVASILAVALANCDFEEKKVKEELYKIKDFPGLTGNTTFDDRGDVLKDVMIKEVRGDGSQKLLDVFCVKE